MEEVLHEHGLADPVRSDEDDVGGVVDEGQGEELLDQRAIDAIGPSPVEVGDRLEGADAHSHPQQAGHGRRVVPDDHHRSSTSATIASRRATSVWRGSRPSSVTSSTGLRPISTWRCRCAPCRVSAPTPRSSTGSTTRRCRPSLMRRTSRHRQESATGRGRGATFLPVVGFSETATFPCLSAATPASSAPCTYFRRCGLRRAAARTMSRVPSEAYSSKRSSEVEAP